MIPTKQEIKRITLAFESRYKFTTIYINIYY